MFRNPIDARWRSVRVMATAMALAWFALAASKLPSAALGEAPPTTILVGTAEVLIAVALLLPPLRRVGVSMSLLVAAGLTGFTLLPETWSMFDQWECGCLGRFRASLTVRRLEASALLLGSVTVTYLSRNERVEPAHG